MHQRLANEFLFRLARRATRIASPALREEDLRDAYQEFHAAFKEELGWYEYERARMHARLAGRPAPSRRDIAESLEPGRDEGGGSEVADRSTGPQAAGQDRPAGDGHGPG
jgi:hypothetical protein